MEYQGELADPQIQVGVDLLVDGDGRTEFLVSQGQREFIDASMRTLLVFGAAAGPVDLDGPQRGVGGYVFDYRSPTTRTREGMHTDRMALVDLDGDGQPSYALGDMRTGRVFIIPIDAG